MPFAAEGLSADATERIGRAWRGLRRGPASVVVIEQLFGRPGERDAIEPTQLDVLDLLHVRDGRRMSDLAGELRVDPSTVTRTLQRMEAAGLAARTPAAEDGRVVTVHMTDEGRRLHAVLAARRTDIMRELLATFSDAERDQFVARLDQFVESLERYVHRAGRAHDTGHG